MRMQQKFRACKGLSELLMESAVSELQLQGLNDSKFLCPKL